MSEVQIIGPLVDIIFNGFLNGLEAKHIYGFKMTVLLDKYKALVKTGKIKPIEQLKPEEKMFYWNQAKSLEGTNEFKINVCKGLYVLDVKAREWQG